MAPPGTKPDLAAHVCRVADVAAEFARRLGLPQRDQRLVQDAALFHHHPAELLDVSTLDSLASLKAPDWTYSAELRNVLLTFHSCSSLVTDQRLFTLSDIVRTVNFVAESLESLPRDRMSVPEFSPTSE